MFSFLIYDKKNSLIGREMSIYRAVWATTDSDKKRIFVV